MESVTGTELIADLLAAGVTKGAAVGLAVVEGVGAGVAVSDTGATGGHRSWALDGADPASLFAAIAAVERSLRPRWVWWSADTARTLVGRGVRVATSWDVAAVHRLIFGGWRAEPGRVWATLNGLSAATLPTAGQLDLMNVGGAESGDPDDPRRPDGHLRPEWTDRGWAESSGRLARWAELAVETAERQGRRLAALTDADPVRAARTARVESTTEQLCAELEADGLPIDRPEIERIVASHIGPRREGREAAEARDRRDRAVLDQVPNCHDLDLRNPADVKALLRRAGIEVADTRAWRLERHRADHPVIDALLGWRKAERIATTFGYGWLDEHVGPDDRLRGRWTSSDGAAGRMTAQAGLHNLPTELRPGVAAEPGFVFVRADLGQIEPRVLAAVSGDDGLRRAAAADDLYAPVAKRLGVERAVAKVAVLAAMYGQTSGTAGRALHGMETAFPTAMAYLRTADERGRTGTDVRTDGGRLVRMGADDETAEPGAQRAAANARGRYARNAMVQGAAAELFKMWAVTVRARLAETDARIVLCLHDELVVHAPEPATRSVVATLSDALDDAAARWSDGISPVRFVAEVSVVRRWSDAKA